MISQISLWTILLVTVIPSVESDIRLPPSIVDGPPTDYMFQSRAAIPLTCTAVGTAELSFVWRKNGIGIDCTTSTRYHCVGNKIVSIESAAADDEGYYQCFVSNTFGSTMSNVMRLRLFNAGSPDSKITQRSVDINQGVSLACNVPATVPTMEEKAKNADSNTPLIEWKITRDGPDDQNLIPVVTSTRVQIHGSTGDLYFSNFDTVGTTFFKCQTTVPNDVAISGFTNVTVVGNAANFPVSNILTNMIPAVGLERQSVVFQCLFQGRPTPQLNAASWKKVGGSLPNGRYNHSDFTTKLRISNLQQSDAGDYTCEPTGSPGAIQTMSLTIEAIPRFDTEADRPHNMNVTEQDTVTISCNAYAIPPANIQWYKNGAMFTLNNLPAKYQLSADLRQLTISNVCKDCGVGVMSDLASIQCNASNTHGYSFVQGYFNVLQRTTIQNAEETVPVKQELLALSCEATTDDSTPVEISWSRGGNPVDENEIVWIASDGSLMFDLRNSSQDSWTSLCGIYICEATNGYSSATITSTLSCDAIIVKSSNVWWVSLIVIGILLLILLLLVLCFFCCIKGNEGEKYPVDEKERQNGNDPVQEIKDKDFKDFQRDPNYQVPFSTIAGSMSAASTLQHPKRFSEQEVAGNDYMDNTAVNPAVWNVQINGAQRIGSASVDGIPYFYEDDLNDRRSFGTGTLNRSASQAIPPPYEVFPNQIELQEGGMGYGLQQPIPSNNNLWHGNHRAMPIGAQNESIDHPYASYEVPPQGQGDFSERNFIEFRDGGREFSVEI